MFNYLSINVKPSPSSSHLRLLINYLSYEALNEWGEFMFLDVSATAMLCCSEWRAYEIMALTAAELGADSFSAESIIIQT